MMAAREKQALRGTAQKAQKGGSERAFCAFCARSFGPCLATHSVTLDDVLGIFPDATIVAERWPIPAGHRELLEAARAAGFPWLRLRPGLAVAGDEDGWRAWLEGFISPPDLALVRRLLAGGYGLITRATQDDVPAGAVGPWRSGLAESFTSTVVQTCAVCGGRCWRRTRDGDVCVVCEPEAAP